MQNTGPFCLSFIQKEKEINKHSFFEGNDFSTLFLKEICLTRFPGKWQTFQEGVSKGNESKHFYDDLKNNQMRSQHSIITRLKRGYSWKGAEIHCCYQ